MNYSLGSVNKDYVPRRVSDKYIERRTSVLVARIFGSARRSVLRSHAGMPTFEITCWGIHSQSVNLSNKKCDSVEIETKNGKLAAIITHI